jgi:membrane-associated phospholipid phosphatase
MDVRLYRDINRFAIDTSWAHGFFRDSAVDGVGVFGLLLLLAWWSVRSGRDAPRGVAAAVWTALATVAAVGINQPVVKAVGRARPFQTVRGAEVLVSRSRDFAFPSDHAVAVGAAAAGLWLVAYYGSRRVRVIAVIGTVLAVLVAFARVYVGVHYPSDVVVGLCVGAAVAIVGWVLLGNLLTSAITMIGRNRLLRVLVRA